MLKKVLLDGLHEFKELSHKFWKKLQILEFPDIMTVVFNKLRTLNNLDLYKVSSNPTL